MSQNKKLLVCAISDPMRNDSCLMFAISMLKLQGLMARVQGLTVNIAFAHDEDKVLDAFKKSEYDYLVILHTMFGFDCEMVLKMVTSDKDFVIGIYPIPGINFEQVKAKVEAGSKEDIKHQGLTYNCTVEGLDFKSKYAQVGSIKDMKVYMITKKVVEDMETVTRAALLTNWASPVYGDAEHQCTSFGPHDFVGCVGLRRHLR